MLTDTQLNTPGLRVRTLELGDTMGMLIAPRHLAVRKSGIAGKLHGYVPGHGGDVWWVEHDDTGVIGAYCVTELDAVDLAKENAALRDELLRRDADDALRGARCACTGYQRRFHLAMVAASVLLVVAVWGWCK